MEADFSGYATKADLKCADGRTITAEAFKHMDGMQVPLVWQHGHDNPENILGHAILEAVGDGVRANGFFNNTPHGQTTKALVEHRDITAMSIFANGLVEKVVGKSKQVLHGIIREVSLVVSGANPGALIDFVAVQHDDGEIQNLTDEAVIYTGLDIELSHAASSSLTLQDVYNTLTEEQKNVVHYMVAAALDFETPGNSMGQSATQTDNAESTEGETAEVTTTEGNLTHQEGTTTVSKNVFEQNGTSQGDGPVLTHSDIKGIFESAQKNGSMKGALEEYALAHGIDNIELLFPDAKAITDRPEWDKRRTEWVANVLTNTHKTPFSKIKTLSANLTLDEARAKGYVKGTLKKEEFFAVSTRSTGPTTIYKKQKLDRDDIIDIQDFDVVAWLWGEIRIMLEEELARAILIGDGREVDDEDKIKDPAAAASGDGIRSILYDHDYYAMTFYVNLDDASSSYTEFVDAMIENRRYYKGTGMPTMYTTEVVIGKFLTLRDAVGRRVYRTLDELASELRVSSIIPVEVMENETDVLAIVVNLQDYNVGTNRGGEITQFDDFDIDYNQYKYLMETRLSGALTKIKSAMIFKKVASTGVLTVPNAPTFVSSTGVVTIVATTGIVYKNKATGGTLSTGAQSALAAGASVTVVATPASSSYYIANNVTDEWTFTRDDA
jgi:hypothetical protein